MFAQAHRLREASSGPGVRSSTLRLETTVLTSRPTSAVRRVVVGLVEMKVRILGCSGGIGAGLRTTSILVDDDVLIDSGTGIGDLPLEELSAIRRVFLTHSHLDHTIGVPFIVDTCFEQRMGDPLIVRGIPATLDVVRRHIFNWHLWPDFGVLPDEDAPVLRYEELEPGAVTELEGRRFHPVEVNHSVPGVGYVVESPDGGVFAFSGDTMTNDTLWSVLNALPRLDVLVIETAFANRNQEVARLAGHYCPATLAADLTKLDHDPEIWITHLKPGDEHLIMDEIAAVVKERKVQQLEGGESWEL